ncbi:toll/interleukin-1 receptor domain-containing protein [Pseudobacillus sp. 179-B 2D1 NHS]|uniref:toll/interleukin-1 receptor domain-containing protein n=1 Tax=Pseudobacillus sp. 179-B 2D1 NHS TaxID=3374292 RepID=UPI003879105B
MNEISYDFFISYNHNDEEYATWIAYLLEEAGYKTFYQAWDFKAGNNFILEMQKGAKFAHHTLALISENYLSSLYTQPEWAAAFGSDPTGALRKLIPVRIQDIELEGLLPQIVYIDLVGKDEEKAKKEILEGVLNERKKPTAPPPFPGIIQKKEKKDETVAGNWYDRWLVPRINDLEDNKFANDIIEGAKLVVHLIPLESLAKELQFPINELMQATSLKPFYTSGWDYKVNKDGFCTFAKWPAINDPHAYVQIFRNGIIESVDSGMLMSNNELKYIPFIKFEKDIITHIRDYYLKSLRNIDVKLPIAISITLFNVSDYFISSNPKLPRERISESTLRLPVVIVNSWEENIETLLKPSFDILWNHCGYEGSLNYTANGEWKEYRGY